MLRQLLKHIHQVLLGSPAENGPYIPDCATCNNRGYGLSHMYPGNGPLSIVPCYSSSCGHTGKYFQELNRRMEAIHVGRDPIEVALNHGESFRSAVDDQLHSWKRLFNPTENPGQPSKQWFWTPAAYKQYPLLADQFVQWFKGMKKKDPELSVMIQTDLGACVIDSLERANDLLSIINKYMQNEDELMHRMDHTDNIVPFPIEERFDFQ